MMRKVEAPEFVYGLGLSSLGSVAHLDDEEMPLRFVSMQLQLPDSYKMFDIDLHAFLFESDGTYVDCVFYKNPTLAGKSIRLLQQERELLVDLRYVPRRCSFIVCTLAIYSGGTVTQLGDSTVKLSALVPRLGLDEGVQFPQFPCGQIPPSSSDLFEWACLGILPLKAGTSFDEECGMMVCLLAQHSGFWYFKPVLKPVTAFTPQGLFGPAQEFVTREVLKVGDEHHGVELGSLLNAIREGNQVHLSSLVEAVPEDSNVELKSGDIEGPLPQASGGRHGSVRSRPQAAAGPYDRQGSDAESWIGSQHYSKEARKENFQAGDHGEEGNQFRISGDEDYASWKSNVEQSNGILNAREDVHWSNLSVSAGSAVEAAKAARAQKKLSSISSQSPADRVGSSGVRKAQSGMARMGNRKAGQETEQTDGLGEGDKAQRAEFTKRGDGRGGKDARDRPRKGFGMDQRNLQGSKDSVRGYELAKSRRDASPIHEGIPRRAQRPHFESTGSAQSPTRTGILKAESLFSSFPSDTGIHGVGDEDDQDLRGAGITSKWKDSVESRLAALEHSVNSIVSDIRAIATATSEMQRNNALYVLELREKFTELKDDVAADIESAIAGPLRALNARLDKVEANEAADAKQLAEQQQQLWAVDRMVVLAERNSHLIAQSLSELRFQQAGFEQRIERAAPTQRTVVPLTDQQKGLPVSLQPAATTATTAPRKAEELAVGAPARNVLNGENSSTEGEEQGAFATKALAELTRMQYHAEEFGACLRKLASGTAPDGVKGLNPIERRVLSFAGTPKVFAALHELERAVDAINLQGSGTSGKRLY